MFKKIIILLLSVSFVSHASIKIFEPSSPIMAADINNNFEYVKQLFQTKDLVFPFSQYNTNTIINRNQFENDFQLVRSQGINIETLSIDQIKSSEINQAFSDMQNAFYLYTERACGSVYGEGTQSFNTSTNMWDTCVYTSCLNDRVVSSDGSECVFVNATGGTIISSGDYKIHIFNNNDSFNLISGKTTGFEILAVGGGGGGGSSQSSLGGGGGGGAGGLIHNTSQTLAIQSYPVTIGNGGNPGVANASTVGQNGQHTTFGSLLLAYGGGGGGHGAGGSAGLSGGSGGGAGYNQYSSGGVRSGGTGVVNQGFAGGASSRVSTNSASGAGGGGANGVGQINQLAHTGGAGGPGKIISISGSTIEYARGGHGGGGHAVVSGAANTGNGGNACYAAGNAGAGGSGIVIVKYLYK